MGWVDVVIYWWYGDGVVYYGSVAKFIQTSTLEVRI